MACGIPILQPGIEPILPAVEAQSLHHWTTSEVPVFWFLMYTIVRYFLKYGILRWRCQIHHLNFSRGSGIVNVRVVLPFVCLRAKSLQSCPTLLDPMDCSLPGSTLHGIFQSYILESVALSFSRGSSQPRDRTHVSCIAGRFFTTEPPGNHWWKYSLLLYWEWWEGSFIFTLAIQIVFNLF